MDPELSHELSEIAEAIRAQLEWQQACGSTGVPRSNEAESVPLAAEGAAPLTASVEESVQAGLAQRVDSVVPQEGGALRALPAAASGAKQLGLASASSKSAHELPGDAEGRGRRLTVLAAEVGACTRCGLHATRKQAVFARGTGSSGLCFVGEGPGADEDLQGYPFVGAAGQLLDRMIEAMGIARDEVYVCNIVKCRPPDNRKPEPGEMAACIPYLEEQLALVAPQVIVALGGTAVQGLLGTSEGITRLRGKWKLYRGRVPVMPTFHPAYLLRTPGAKREVWDDLQSVLRQMGRGIPERRR